MKLRVLENTTHRDIGFWARILHFCSTFDYVQILSILTLLTVSLTFIYSTGMGMQATLDFFWKQVGWIGVGMAAWAFFAVTDYRKWEPFSWAVYFLALLLLVAVLFFGKEAWGARRWLTLNFGFFSQQLQPSELGKIGLILVLASTLGNRNFNIAKWRHLLVVAALIIVPFALVVVEPDLSGSLIFLPIGGVMVFIAGLRLKKIAILAVAALAVFGMLGVNEYYEIVPVLRPYHRERIKTFLNPQQDITGRDYNAYQARLAVGSGGLAGKGIGQGTQNTLGFLPQTVSNNDFIFSVIAEESGFIGSQVVLLAILVLWYSVLRTAWIATSEYGRYLAVGFAVMLFEHTFINVGMSIGLAPVTGLPLPLVSYGGTFLLTTLSMLGVIQSIYRHSNEELKS